MTVNLHFETEADTRLWEKKLMNAQRVLKFVPVVGDEKWRDTPSG